MTTTPSQAQATDSSFDLTSGNRIKLGETLILGIMIACATVAIAVTVGIVFSLLFESIRFFEKVPMTEFLFGTQWSPQTALRADQVGASGSFGAVPLITGTLLISAIAMSVATPLGLFSAIYLSEYASNKTRSVVKPLLEILAGIPTVVYGFFAALTVAPLLRSTGEGMGLNVSSESALACAMRHWGLVRPRAKQFARWFCPLRSLVLQAACFWRRHVRLGKP